MKVIKEALERDLAGAPEVDVEIAIRNAFYAYLRDKRKEIYNGGGGCWDVALPPLEQE